MNPNVWKDTVTIYQYANGTYNRFTLHNAFWDDSYKGSEQKQGTLIKHGVSLFLPYYPELESLAVGVDRSAPYLVRGLATYDFAGGDNLIEQIREFEAEYKDRFWRPKEVNPCKFGSRELWHFEVVL